MNKLCRNTVVCALSLSAPFNATADDDTLGTFKVLKPEIAIEIARATMMACREKNYQVAVAIVDRSGITQVVLRDQLAGPHTLDAAHRKAWTAASFNVDTRSIAKATQPGSGQSGARFASNTMMAAGGVPLYAEGSLVGAVGVSGAPSADEDQNCANKGSEALEELLLF
jgi:uncharacterized protein GlcG (DUF336 family)